MYTRTPAITSFFAFGGSSAFAVLEDEPVVDELEAELVEGCCILDEGFAELDVDVEGAGLSSWFLSFSRR